jgi:2-oxoglutarate ferredoxin oxidoreductase subunit alpha
MQGNEAIAEGAIRAGVRFFAGYPITPATEIAEYMAQHLPEVGGSYNGRLGHQSYRRTA